LLKDKLSKMNRREVIRNIAAGSVTLFVVPAALTSCSKEEIEPDPDPNPDLDELSIDLTDDKYNSLLSEGGFYIEENVIIINTGADLLPYQAYVRTMDAGCPIIMATKIYPVPVMGPFSAPQDRYCRDQLILH